MIEIRLIPQKEFERIHNADLNRHNKLELLGDMCRANALTTVKHAGSGHLGSAEPSADLYLDTLNTAPHCVLDGHPQSSSKRCPGFELPGHIFRDERCIHVGPFDLFYLYLNLLSDHLLKP